MDRVRKTKKLLVPLFLCLWRKFSLVLLVEVVESLDALIARLLAVRIECLEKASADDLVSFVSGSGHPRRLHAAENLLQSEQRLFTFLPTDFGIAFWQGADNERARSHLRCLS